jgi:hypothetical protein
MDEEGGIVRTAVQAAKEAPVWMLALVAIAASGCAFVPWLATFKNPLFVSLAVPLDLWALARLPGAIHGWNARRRVSARGTFFLTPIEHFCLWGSVQQSDGSTVTTVYADFHAKNRTSAPLHLVHARLLKPRLGSEVQKMVFVRNSGLDNVIWPDETVVIHVNIAVIGMPKRPGPIKAVIEVSDSDGNARKVKITLRDPRHPFGLSKKVVES